MILVARKNQAPIRKEPWNISLPPASRRKAQIDWKTFRNDDELNQMRKYIPDNPFSAGNHHDKNELDFIINYDIKYRMGRDGGDEEEE